MGFLGGGRREVGRGVAEAEDDLKNKNILMGTAGVAWNGGGGKIEQRDTGQMAAVLRRI